MKPRPAIIFAVLALGACTTETITYVDRPPFNPPPDASAGFLGYFTVSSKQTTCGNCHVLHQRDWSGTAHSHAWSDLVESGHQAANGSCDACHSVSSYGNMAAAPAGYKKVADSAYHDVQCESCHGPGFEHVSAPDAVGNAPLANVFVDTAVNGPGTCAACHSGTHTPYWEDWKQSLHAAQGATRRRRMPALPHRQGALNPGVTAAYIGSDNPIGANAFGITCAVCHDPHGTAKDPVTGLINEAQLRYPLSSSDPSRKLCMKCHYRRTEPLAMDSTRVESPGGSNSPHAPQGATVIGEFVYQNPAYLDPVLIDVAKTASHGNLTKNPKLCAGCHVHPFSSTDAPAGRQSSRPVTCSGRSRATDLMGSRQRTRSRTARTLPRSAHSSRASRRAVMRAKTSLPACWRWRAGGFRPSPPRCG
jgi:hypothetical protein